MSGTAHEKNEPTPLVRQRDACRVLLEYIDAIPDSLEAELYAYVQALDNAIAQSGISAL